MRATIAGKKFLQAEKLIIPLNHKSPLTSQILAVLLLVCYRLLVNSGLFYYKSICYTNRLAFQA